MKKLHRGLERLRFGGVEVWGNSCVGPLRYGGVAPLRVVVWGNGCGGKLRYGRVGVWVSSNVWRLQCMGTAV